jgi:hypothetical protein
MMSFRVASALDGARARHEQVKFAFEHLNLFARAVSLPE